MSYLSIGSQLGTGGELTLSEETTVQEIDGITHAAGTIIVSTGSVFEGLSRGTANQVLTVNSGGTDIEWTAAAGGGNVSGPGSSTDNAVARFSGTDGATIQNSGIIIDDSDNISGIVELSVQSIDHLVNSVTAAHTAASETVILCDATTAAFTVTLPAAASNTNRLYRIKKTDTSTNAVTIDGNAAETIDDGTTMDLTIQYESVDLVCDGSNWFIL